MSCDELQVRFRQQAAKRWDALTRIGTSFATEKYDPGIHSRGRFFFSNHDLPGLFDLLREQCPGTVDNIVNQAEKICRHCFDLLGYRDVSYGREIDWHLDAVHGKQAPRRPWFRIPYLDFHEVGDVKITWELNRHQHLVTLAKAYLLTRESRYLGELLQQWYHWHEHNPYGVGVNWSSSLEVAFRSLSWIWILQLIGHCETVPLEFAADLNRALLMNARHIERYLSTYFSPNTHLLGEGVGLFFIGTLVSGSRRTRDWQERGWEIVLQEAKRQVLADGMHFELSTYYHVYALDFFLHARILASLNGLGVPPIFDQTITKMLTALAALANPGPLPHFGDDDGGRLFDPSRNQREHMTDPLYTGAALFNKAQWKKTGGCIPEEMIWLLGAEGVKRLAGLQAERQQVTSVALPSSGMYVMHAGTPSQQLVIDSGPHAGGRSGHAHADALSVQLAVNGHMIVVDPGTAAYVHGRGDRDKFRSTAAHNTIQVDGMSQADCAGPFGWGDLPAVSAEWWVNGKSFDLFAGSHHGYSRLPDPVLHRRYVFYLKEKLWFVRDVLTGENRHEVQGSWHFAPGTLAAVQGGARFSTSDQAGLLLLVAGTAGYRHSIDQDAFSPVYGQTIPAPTLHFSANTVLPAEYATLFLPQYQFNDLPGVLRMAERDHSSGFVQAYYYSTAAQEFCFVFSAQDQHWQAGPWASDARFLFSSVDAKETPDLFILCDGSYLEFRGQRIFASSAALSYVEWYQEDLIPHFSCSDESSVTLSPMQAAALVAPALATNI